MNHTFQVAYRSKGRPWHNPELLERFLSGDEPGPSDQNWCVLQWQEAPPQEDGLQIYLSVPNPEKDRSTQLKLAELVQQKLSNGFERASQEKGWPRPRFFVRAESEVFHEEWSYRLQLGPHQTTNIIIHPNKVLAVGEEDALAVLLGLECLDPVFGLSAKWVTYSQTERAANSGCLLFEASEVIMSHAISFTESRAVHATGHWEVAHWLAGALPTLGESGFQLMERHVPLAVCLVQSFVKEGLHLPQPAPFAEALLQAVTGLDNPEPHVVESSLRNLVVRHNQPRWLDAEGMLVGIEWKGPSELDGPAHHRMLNRLSQSLAPCQESDGVPILLVDAPLRKTLASSLAGLFPELPVVGWNELDDLSCLRIAAKIDAELKVESSVPPAGFYSTEFPSNKL